MMLLYEMVPSRARVAGFGYTRHVLNLETYRTVRVPLWFTTTALVVLAVWLWWRGRAKAKLGGFDVLPATG